VSGKHSKKKLGKRIGVVTKYLRRLKGEEGEIPPKKQSESIYLTTYGNEKHGQKENKKMKGKTILGSSNLLRPGPPFNKYVPAGGGGRDYRLYLISKGKEKSVKGTVKNLKKQERVIQEGGKE